MWAQHSLLAAAAPAGAADVDAASVAAAAAAAAAGAAAASIRGDGRLHIYTAVFSSRVYAGL